MKKITNSIFTIIFLFNFNLFAQNIIQVNNTAGALADYNSLQEALDAAVAGDIIYLYGSSTSYGLDTISKSVTIVGPGYFLSQNPETQVDKTPATIETLTINGAASNVLVTGIKLGTVRLSNTSQVILQRNHINCQIVMDNVSNISIKESYFVGNCGDQIDLNANCSNIIVSNNLFGKDSGGDAVDIASTSSGQFFNNVIFDDMNPRNSSFFNNIFLKNTGLGSNNNYQNNVFVGNEVSVAANNLVNVASNSIFEGFPTQGSLSDDGRWILKSGSPAIAAGQGGIDAGAFSGDSPYILSGIPFIPNIYELIAPPSGTSAGGIEVTVKAKANNN